MSKKRIGELNGKPIVIGDHNMVNENEILLSYIGKYIALSERDDKGELQIITAGEIFADHVNPRPGIKD